jgi:hypothetical protein
MFLVLGIKIDYSKSGEFTTPSIQKAQGKMGVGRRIAALVCVFGMVATWVAMSLLLQNVQDSYRKPYLLVYLIHGSVKNANHNPSNNFLFLFAFFHFFVYFSLHFVLCIMQSVHTCASCVHCHASNDRLKIRTQPFSATASLSQYSQSQWPSIQQAGHHQHHY